MVHVVEEALYVGLYHISIPPVLQVKGQVTDRIPCPASGPVPITAPQKLRLIDRIQEPGGVYPRSPECPTASLGRCPLECIGDESTSPGTASSSGALPVPRHWPAGALHTSATSLHPPPWPLPYSGRPSSPGGARHSSTRKGPEIGAACRLSPCRLCPAGRWACVLPIQRCPAQVSCAGCVLPSRPSPCTWLSPARSPRRDTTPQRPPAGFPFHRTPPPP